MSTDLTFITNESGRTLLDRFKVLIKGTSLFDCLSGYFYVSGFYKLYPSLEPTEKVRILVGIKTDRGVYNLIQEAKEYQKTLSTKEAREGYAKEIVKEFENSQDTEEVEQGSRKFLEWIQLGKLEIRAYREHTIHAKLYIMTFKEGGPDDGRVITGSSNFTEAGLKDNIEFNVELKNSSDYHFALQKFNELWEKSVPVSEDCVAVVKTKTWMNDTITPYELYLKFLYEYFVDKIDLDKQELEYDELRPLGFKELAYQNDAVRDAKSKLDKYGGVFLSDVVGLGKTYMAALLANELKGRTLVVAPPGLLDEANPGSWPNVFRQFGVRGWKAISIGSLDDVLSEAQEYRNIIIDESHRFRNENTQMYSKLFDICRTGGKKKVILVSATPLNNRPIDILSQIKLFQDVHKSTLPNPQVRDLEAYFNRLQEKLKDLDRREDKEEYLRIVKENSNDIRKNVLQYLMVRRTRNNIVKYYGQDLKRQKLKFPEVEDPRPLIYTFDKNLDEIFNKTLKLIREDFTSSRYTPLLYLKKDLDQPTEISQMNMETFIKTLLLKRLESSFWAFKQTLNRFIGYYERFIKEYQNGYVYISKKYSSKIFELLDDEEAEEVEKIVKEGKAEKYTAADFKGEFIEKLQSDLETLNKIWEMWKEVNDDPKIDKFVERLSKDRILKENRLIVFTESKETAEYLGNELQKRLSIKVFPFSSLSGEEVRRNVIENFDANSKTQRNDYQVLISTDILSEGVNLHRSNVVINYDIPWNPIKMMQRVGRINRVDTKFDEIYTYNFFPALQVDNEIKLKEAAEAKIKAFIEMLGNDSRLLTDEEIKSHDLFSKLNSKISITGEEEEDYELKYLTFIRKIRDEDKELYNKVKLLPKKARTGKHWKDSGSSVITFFRRDQLQKIFKTNAENVEEVDFEGAVKIIEAESKTKREPLGNNFYNLLDLNKKGFDKLFSEDEAPIVTLGGRNVEGKLLGKLNAVRKAEGISEEDTEYVWNLIQKLRAGGIDKRKIKMVLKVIERETLAEKILPKIKAVISKELTILEKSSNTEGTEGPREVILSEYLAPSD